MEIHYCGQCGMRIGADEIAQGRVRKVDDHTYHCAKCSTPAVSSPSRSSRTGIPVPKGERAEAGLKRSAGSPVSGRHAKELQRAGGGFPILPVAGGSVLLVAVIAAFALLQNPGAKPQAEPERSADADLRNRASPGKDAQRPEPADAPAGQKAAASPPRTPDMRGATPPPPPRADEKAAQEAFAVLEQFDGLAPDDRAGRIARVEEFLAQHGDALVASRARVLLGELKSLKTINNKSAQETLRPYADVAAPATMPPLRPVDSTEPVRAGSPTAVQSPGPRAAYARFLDGLQGLICAQNWTGARERLAQAGKDPALAGFAAEIRLDGECLALAEQASQAVPKGAAVLADGRDFVLLQADGKRLEVGKSRKVVVTKVEDGTLRIDQDIGGGSLTRKVPLSALSPETCFELSRLGLPEGGEGQLALALLKLPVLRAGNAPDAAKGFGALLDQAAAGDAVAEKVARLRAWADHLGRERAAAAAWGELEALVAAKKADEAPVAFKAFAAAHAGTAFYGELGGKLGEMGKALEEFSPLKRPGPATDAWTEAAAALPLNEQLKLVKAKLKELNPQWPERDFSTKVENDRATALRLSGQNLTHITPLRVLKDLRRIDCGIPMGHEGQLDLAPLSQLPELRDLNVYNCRVSDLSPLRGSKIEVLNIEACRIKDFAPLTEMPNLKRLAFDLKPGAAAAEMVGRMPSVQAVNGMSRADFLKKCEGQ